MTAINPVALPLTTVVPMKQTFTSAAISDSAGVEGCACFSTGKDSPVSGAWFTNRSFAAITRRSAGIRSPADRWTMSPGTS